MLAIAAIVLLGLYIYLGYKEPAIALVTSPFVAGTLLVVAATEEDYAAMTVAPLICLATLITTATSKHDTGSDGRPQTFARWILIILMLLVVFGVACIVFAPFGATGILFVAFFLGSLIAYRMTSQHATVSYVISTIGASMRQNLPLPVSRFPAAGGKIGFVFSSPGRAYFHVIPFNQDIYANLILRRIGFVFSFLPYLVLLAPELRPLNSSFFISPTVQTQNSILLVVYYTILSVILQLRSAKKTKRTASVATKAKPAVNKPQPRANSRDKPNGKTTKKNNSQ